jgi:hypothetical protein
MNDTTRQVGGAVGVALLGSILSSRYGASVSDALAGRGVPGTFVQTARDSVGAALKLVSETPGARRFAPAIVPASHNAFVHGLHTATTAAAVLLVLAALGVVRWLPARAHDHEPAPVRAGAADPAGAADAVPMGIGPVDVVPADVAADLADELEFRHGTH